MLIRVTGMEIVTCQTEKISSGSEVWRFQPMMDSCCLECGGNM